MTFPNEKTPAAASKTAAAPADAAAAHSKTGADAPAACAGCVHDDPHADRTSTPCTTATRRLADVSRTFNQWLTYGQAAALIAIAVAAIGGIGQAGWEMIAARSISLGDLLMLFLYVEILSIRRLHSPSWRLPAISSWMWSTSRPTTCFSLRLPSLCWYSHSGSSAKRRITIIRKD